MISITSATKPDLAGVVIRDELIPFQITDSLGTIIIQGNVQDRVTRSSNTGRLIFTPRLRDLSNPGNVAWIMGFEMQGFAGFLPDVDYRTDGLGHGRPRYCTRSASGDSLFFSYDPSLIVPTDESQFLSIKTVTSNFDLTGVFTIYAQNDFGASVFSTTLSDVSAPSIVPVLAAVWLFGSDLIGLLGVSRRKNQKY